MVIFINLVSYFSNVKISVVNWIMFSTTFLLNGMRSPSYNHSNTIEAIPLLRRCSFLFVDSISRVIRVILQVFFCFTAIFVKGVVSLLDNDKV